MGKPHGESICEGLCMCMREGQIQSNRVIEKHLGCGVVESVLVIDFPSAWRSTLVEI